MEFMYAIGLQDFNGKRSPGIGPSKNIQISRSKGLLSWFWHGSFLLQNFPFRFSPLYLL
ncbi:hypothetical protein NC651_007893 [Populus alba x Populus x berolinensis]|nr:hypothetical protein NC651_007893 [Populus alba x Populus x berolinensis]